MFFQKLFDLARQGPLVMTVTADTTNETMTVVVTPKVGKDVADPALNQQLSLTGKPDEFDSSFFGLIEGYTGARKSLIEQAEATAEVLAAAKQAQIAKASSATAKGSAKAAASPASKPGASVAPPAGTDPTAATDGDDEPDDPSAADRRSEEESLFG
jgi:PRTRC genetic system protein E